MPRSLIWVAATSVPEVVPMITRWSPTFRSLTEPVVDSVMAVEEVVFTVTVLALDELDDEAVVALMVRVEPLTLSTVPVVPPPPAKPRPPPGSSAPPAPAWALATVVAELCELARLMPPMAAAAMTAAPTPAATQVRMPRDRPG